VVWGLEGGGVLVWEVSFVLGDDGENPGDGALTVI
jgi:hypothetical protein